MNRLLRECLGHVGHVSLDLVQFGLEIESDLDTWFKLFSKFPDYKYVPYDIRKKKNVITSRNNNSRRTATPNSRISSK